jgi:hypothetical protein
MIHVETAPQNLTADAWHAICPCSERVIHKDKSMSKIRKRSFGVVERGAKS